MAGISDEADGGRRRGTAIAMGLMRDVSSDIMTRTDHDRSAILAFSPV